MPTDTSESAGPAYPMFSRFDPVELASGTGVVPVVSTEFQIPTLPSGSMLIINVLSTWYAGFEVEK